jgi:hypothetical protein
MTRQPTALLGPVRSERGHDERAPGAQSPEDVSHVPLAVISMGEKVEDGPVVPDVHHGDWPFGRDVGLNPRHQLALGSRRALALERAVPEMSSTVMHVTARSMR